MAKTSDRRANRTALLTFVPVLGAALLIAVVVWPWYRWATAGATPYDEMGIEINSYMPGPLHDWACGRVLERFPRALPPYGCKRG